MLPSRNFLTLSYIPQGRVMRTKIVAPTMIRNVDMTNAKVLLD
jgi:hypothetical protein